MRLSTYAAAALLPPCVVIACAQSASAPINIYDGSEIYDGFETPTLSKLWETDRFVPGAIEMQSAIVRAGHGAVKISIHPNDKFEAGINGNADSERDELLEAKDLTSKEDVPYEFSWSFFLPPDFPIVPVRLVIAQWKQYCNGDGKPCSDDSPVLAVRYIGGVFQITQDLAHKHIILFEEKRDLRSHWLDLRFQVRFTPATTGRIKAWLREGGSEKQVIDYTGITANAEDSTTGYASPSHFYFKMGLYRNVMREPMTIYIDEYRKKQLPPDAF
jgi:Polysaccharide lyase